MARPRARDGYQIFLDALLPGGEVEVDATWDLDDAAERRVLRLDVQAGMYSPPAPEEGGAEGRPRRGNMLGGELRLLRGIEWKGKAKFAAREDVDGKPCARIELEIEGAGEVADPERTSGGGRMFDPLPARALASTVQVKLEGTLEVSLADKRPAKLELEGPISIESSREREREGRTIKIETKSEGTLTHHVSVGAEG